MSADSGSGRDGGPADGRLPGPAAEAWELIVELLLSSRPWIAAVVHEFDLAPMQIHALRALRPGGELPMGSLADALACDPSNVTGIVDRLERRGLIERRGSARDRRVKMLVLTPAGERLRDRLLERMQEPPAALLALSRADQRALRDALRKAADA